MRQIILLVSLAFILAFAIYQQDVIWHQRQTIEYLSSTCLIGDDDAQPPVDLREF